MIVGTGDAAHRHATRATSTRWAARRCGSTGSPGRRGRATRSPRPSTNRRYVHTFGHRNVQGLAAAQRTARSGRWSTARTATTRSTCLVNGSDYGWHPVPGYNESVPMTDHEPPRRPGRGQVELRASRRSPPPAAPSSTARSGARSTARSRSPASRPAASLFLTFDGSGNFQRKRVPAALTQVRAAPDRHPGAGRRPARHHLERRRPRRDPAGQRRSSASRRPVEEVPAGADRGDPDRERDDGHHQRALRVRHEPAAGHHRHDQPDDQRGRRRPSRARRVRWRRTGRTSRPCRPRRRTPTARSVGP